MKLVDVNKLSLQEAVDYTMTNIVKQGIRCVNSRGQCRYTNDKGHHCVVGWLLDEEDTYLMSSEKTITSLKANCPDLIPDVIKKYTPFFTVLQNFHDSFTLVRRRYYYEELKRMNKVDMTKPYWDEWIDNIAMG